jgi:hypothetical protein
MKKAFLIGWFMAICSCNVTMLALPMTIPVFDTAEDAAYWIAENIEYRSDWENRDSDLVSIENWMLPWDTLSLGYGDCEDSAALLCWIAEEQNLGEEIHIVLLAWKGSFVGHAGVRIDGYHYETTARLRPTEDMEIWRLEDLGVPRICDTLTLRDYIYEAQYSVWRNTK